MVSLTLVFIIGYYYRPGAILCINYSKHLQTTDWHTLITEEWQVLPNKWHKKVYT